MKTNRKCKQGGGIMLTLVGVLAIAAALYWALAGGGAQSNNATTAIDVATARMLGVTAQGDELKDGIGKLMAKGIPISGITFDTAANTGSTAGLFNTTDNITQPQIPDVNALVTGLTSPDGTWVYKANTVKVNGISTAAADYALALDGVAQQVCEAINFKQHGATTIPASGVAASAWYTAATAIDMSAVAGVANWISGCVSTSDATPKYTYFIVVVPQ